MPTDTMLAMGLADTVSTIVAEELAGTHRTRLELLVLLHMGSLATVLKLGHQALTFITYLNFYSLFIIPNYYIFN